MTIQINDSVFHRRIRHALIDWQPDNLFNPKDYGLEPLFMGTSCYRGYFCSYEIKESRLVLTSLTMRPKDPRNLFNVVPIKTKDNNWQYHDLNHLLPFSGILVVQANYLRDLYLRLTLQVNWKHHKVSQLEFENGKLRSVVDVSKEMAEYRAYFMAEAHRIYEERIFRVRIKPFLPPLNTEEIAECEMFPLAIDEPIEVTLSSTGWVQCPNCGTRFKPSSRSSFDGERHWCLQRLIIRGVKQATPIK
jgi:hypothetical protein